MFWRDGGMAILSGTEKQSPCACPSPWYGSCPRMTTFTASNGVSSKALKMNFGGGKTFAERYSQRTKSVSSLKYSFSNSVLSASFHVGSILISFIGEAYLLLLT